MFAASGALGACGDGPPESTSRHESSPATTIVDPRLFAIEAPWRIEWPPGRELTEAGFEAIRRPRFRIVREALDAGGWRRRSGIVPGEDRACWYHPPRRTIHPDHLAEARVLAPDDERLRRVRSLRDARAGDHLVNATGVYVVRDARLGPPGAGWRIQYPAASPAGEFAWAIGRSRTRLATRPVEMDGDTRLAALLPPRTAVAFPVDVPLGATLSFGYGVAAPGSGVGESVPGRGTASSRDDTIGVRVHAREEGREERLLLERTIGDGLVGRFVDVQVPLDDVAGRNVWLAFSTFVAGESTADARRAPDRPLPPLDRAAYLASPVVQPPAHDPGAPADVIVLVVDTLRADALSAYGNPRPITPHLDALAADGVLFERARSPSSWTLPAHATLFTSLPPPRHGVHENATRLSPRLHTLAEVLAESGYQTAAFTEGIWVAARLGIGQGFDRYVETRGGIEPVLALATQWLESRTTPSFTFLHTYEVHGPYDPPEAERAQWVRPYRGPLPRAVHPARVADALAAEGRTPDAEDARYVRDLYEAEVAHADAAIGRFLARLRDAGRFDRTLFVVTSDHGEEFLEHGAFDHHRTLYEEMLRVPLVVRLPGRFEGGRRVGDPVGLEDLAPSILHAVDLPIPSEWEGAWLLEPDRDRPFLASLWPRGTPAPGYAVLEGTRKWIRHPPGWMEASTAREQAFDLAVDPGETQSVWTSDDDARFATLLERLGAGPGFGAAHPAAGAATVPVEDPEDLPRLRELGYVR